jgi:hypothetical protein
MNPEFRLFINPENSEAFLTRLRGRTSVKIEE